MDALRRLVATRRPFPTKLRPTLTMIYSAASDAKVVEGLLVALGPDQAASIQRVPASMHDPAAIAAALEAARSDWAGGSSNRFLNPMRV